MDWKLLLIGVVMAVIGGVIMWRFRKSKFNSDLGAGCVMALGLVLVGTGILTALFGFWIRW